MLLDWQSHHVNEKNVFMLTFVGFMMYVLLLMMMVQMFFLYLTGYINSIYFGINVAILFNYISIHPLSGSSTFYKSKMVICYCVVYAASNKLGKL